MKKSILIYETKKMGKVDKIERAKEEDIEKLLISKGMSKSEAKDTVKKLLSGEVGSIPLREVKVKRRVIEVE